MALDAAHAAITELVGRLTHVVLEVVRESGFPISRQLRAAGGNPLDVLQACAETLRALADGLEDPVDSWPSD
ncbi:MAG: hypothetical protein WEG56_04385 [Chloroflexota bacterium]